MCTCLCRCRRRRVYVCMYLYIYMAPPIDRFLLLVRYHPQHYDGELPQTLFALLDPPLFNKTNVFARCLEVQHFRMCYDARLQSTLRMPVFANLSRIGRFLVHFCTMIEACRRPPAVAVVSWNFLASDWKHLPTQPSWQTSYWRCCLITYPNAKISFLPRLESIRESLCNLRPEGCSDAATFLLQAVK